MRICAPQLGLSKSSKVGGGVVDYQILNALSDFGVEIEIPLMLGMDCEKAKNWRVYEIPLKRMYKLGPLLTNTVFLVWTLFIWFRRRFDILRISYPEYAGYMSIIIGRLLRVRTVAVYHHLENENKFERSIHSLIANSFSHILTPSEHTKREIIARYNVVPQRISVVRYGVERKLLQPRQRSKSLVKKYQLQDKKILLFVGSLIPRKNLFFLIDTFEKVALRYPDTVLIICGKGYPKQEYGERLEEYVEKKGINEKVIFTGEVFGEQKAELYYLCDIFVFPSLLEGFGIAVAEAMVCGRPVVALRCSSLPEVVQDGATGFLACPKDKEDFLNKILSILENPNLGQRIGKAARLHATQNFDWHKAAEQNTRIFRSILEKEKSD